MARVYQLNNDQRKVLCQIAQAGSIVMQSYGRFLGAGEYVKAAPVTILRLLGLGLLEFYEPLRLRCTDKGRDEADRHPTF